MAHFKILAFPDFELQDFIGQTLEFKILVKFKSLESQNSEFKILTDFKMFENQNPEIQDVGRLQDFLKPLF